MRRTLYGVKALLMGRLQFVAPRILEGDPVIVFRGVTGNADHWPAAIRSALIKVGFEHNDISPAVAREQRQ